MTSRLLLTLLHFSLYTIITILTTLPSIASAEKITFPKIDRRPKPDVSKPREMRRLPKYNLGSHEVIDLRNRDLSKLDLCDSFEDLMYIESDSRTVWPASDKMPSGFDPQEIMELGKNPGLGIRSLHKQGITGRGVRIAIIDLPLLVDHQEYADRLQLYEEIEVHIDAHSTGHGCMTASVAVGKTVGVAPEAELFFIGHYGKKRGAQTLQGLAQCIHRIVEINEQLPQDKKIRAISISQRWSRDDLSDKEYKIITDAVQKARAAGMLVVTCCVDLVHEGCDYAGLGRPPLADPDVFESYKPVLWAAERFWEGRYHPYEDSSEGVFFVPLDSRTTASEDGGIDEYLFDRCGGFSKAPPYTAGVYALAVQVDPAITPERFWALAAKTGRTIEVKREGKSRRLGPILDPVKLIRSIEASELTNVSRKQSDNHPLQTRTETASRAKTIMPGMGIGDFTLGMSKDEVLKKLGRPGVIAFAGKRYTLDNLPRRYIMYFGDISFAMVDDALIGISAHSPSYKLANGLRVGDSKEKRLEAFDDDELEYDDKGVLVRVDEKSGTVREITVYPADRDDDQDEDDPAEGFDPDVLLEAGKNPGLGVRALHAQGITGAGVHVGLIDMGVKSGHPEYAGKIVSYNPAATRFQAGSMHGPYVTSLLVGKQCGTAPGAKLHVEAVDLAEHDAGLCARALDRFVAYNESASKDQRIRVVSVSSGPSGEGSDYRNQSLWDESVQRAEAQGILVLDLTWHHGIVSICWMDVKDRENVEACTPGFRFGPVEVDEGHIHVPRTPRTSARAPSRGPFSYKYADGGRRSNRPYSKSGYSPTIPYAAGVLAMGWQIRPDLTAAQMKELLFESAHVHKSGAKIINPTAFIDLVRKQRPTIGSSFERRATTATRETIHK